MAADLREAIQGWAEVFGTALVGLLLVGIVQGILTAPFAGNWFSQGLVAAIASVLTYAYTTALVVLIYLDLRSRKEGLDQDRLRAELGRTGS